MNGRQAPFALVGSVFEVTHVVGLLPHQHFRGSPCVTQALLGLVKQPYAASQSALSAGSVMASQPSVLGTQLSTVHWSQIPSPMQWVGNNTLLGVQTPALQASPKEHMLPSSQLDPSAATGSVQVPVAG